MSQTQEHLKLKDEFTKLGKNELSHILYLTDSLTLLLGIDFLQIAHLDDELKNVREKNREYEASQERLSSEQVRKNKTSHVNNQFLT